MLLLDEPFSNLDKLLTEKLFSFVVNEVNEGNTSVILITHVAEEALKYADRIAVVENGKILQIGKKWDVYYKPKNSRLAGLLGDYNRIKQKDLHFSSTLKIKSTLFLRPDKIKLASSKNNMILYYEFLHCSFNGKCFEVLCETINNNSIIIYSNNEIGLNTEQKFYFDF